MQNQVKTIDVDQIWMSGKHNPCSTYIKYTKVEKKYIKPIEDNISVISKNRILKKKFSKATNYGIKKRIYAILRYVDIMDDNELDTLINKDMSDCEFILKVDELRGRNYYRSIEESRHLSQT